MSGVPGGCAVTLAVLLTAASACYVFPNDVPDPCRGVTCAPGAVCRSSPDGRTAQCHCPASCPSYGDHTGSRPLCGSDARDYPGECQMRRSACESGTNITVKYHGKCDPCAGIACPDPEVCQLDELRSPACRCAEPCPLEFSPVCASDGKTYSNLCHMNRESCRAKKQLRVIFKGQCSSGLNPCSEVVCRHGAECRVDAVGAAHCACANPCEPVLRPVCGSDGSTHDSECALRRTSCQLGQDVTVVHAGACGSRGACVGRVCPHGGECVATGASGSGECRCPACSAEFSPVCGSDGISYGNRCKLRLEACRHKRDVTVLYDGPCNGCENKKCELYAVCESDGVSEASCVCPAHCEAGTDSELVCGSDNRTHASLCALRDTACRGGTHIALKHMGACESCLGVECPAGSSCARGTCSCTSCAGVSREPVCSTTRRTYPHECALRRAACERRARGDRTPLAVAFYGECGERDAFHAGTNGSAKTRDHSNEIRSGGGAVYEPEGEGEAEGRGQAVARACSNIHCDYSATCSIGPDGLPRCSCLFDCASAASAPVCASDLRLYPTLCHMKLEACNRQEDLRLRPLELCRGLEVKPCGGEAPLVDPTTGRPLDCGNGPMRKDCPAGSYCHQTSKSARCCKKDTLVEEKKGCEDSWHGCCPDGRTPARGPHAAGCPRACGCNRLGSFSERCAADGGQCDCRPGVGGVKCDRCEPGYWGLSRVGAGHAGCIPCGCSAFGSVREDCEQMTGRCVCKPGIQGQKCTMCTNHDHVLGPNGCYDAEIGILPPTSCDRITCHFGALCSLRGGFASCACADHACPPEAADTPVVCGSDGKTYTSACQLRSHACATQTDVVVQAFGICSEEVSPVVRRGNKYKKKFNNIKRSANDTLNCSELIKPIKPNYKKPSKHKTTHKTEQHNQPLDEKDSYEESDFPTFKVPLLDAKDQIKVQMRLPSNRFDIWAEVDIICEDGVIVSSFGAKDHLWLGITSGNVELKWNAGGGALVLRVGNARKGYSRIEARRYRRDALLRANGGVVRGSAPGNMTILNLDGSLYIGRPHSNITKFNRNVKHIGGFVGCIHRLRIGHTTLIPPTHPSPLVASPGVKECTAHNMAEVKCPQQNKLLITP